MVPEGDIEGGQLCYQNQVYKLVNTQSFDDITAANNVSKVTKILSRS